MTRTSLATIIVNLAKDGAAKVKSGIHSQYTMFAMTFVILAVTVMQWHSSRVWRENDGLSLDDWVVNSTMSRVLHQADVCTGISAIRIGNNWSFGRRESNSVRRKRMRYWNHAAKKEWVIFPNENWDRYRAWSEVELTPKGRRVAEKLPKINPTTDTICDDTERLHGIRDGLNYMACSGFDGIFSCRVDWDQWHTNETARDALHEGQS